MPRSGRRAPFWAVLLLIILTVAAIGRIALSPGPTNLPVQEAPHAPQASALPPSHVDLARAPAPALPQISAPSFHALPPAAPQGEGSRTNPYALPPIGNTV